jgi:hypothetical protein
MIKFALIVLAIEIARRLGEWVWQDTLLRLSQQKSGSEFSPG